MTPPATPYVGLRAYRRTEHGLFFGRDREARDLAIIWQATGLTVLYGASGSGKTSLLHAGVVPRIDSARADLLPLARARPRGGPQGNPYVLGLLSDLAPGQPVEALAGLTISGFLGRRPELKDRYGDPMPILVAIDQAEEFFNVPAQHEDERDAFLSQLAEAVVEHNGLHLLLALREEHLASVLPHERLLGRGSRARFQLLPLTRAAALDAVVRPLEGTHRSFAPGAAELLVDNLRTVTFSNDEGQTSRIEGKTVEPVQIQVVCSALWESLEPGLREISVEHVRLRVDVDRFLIGFCRRMLERVAADHGRTPGEIQYWLRKAFITEHGTRNSVYEGLHETAGMPNEVAAALEDRHILRGEHRLGIRWYELQHDRLISAILTAAPPTTYLDDARAALERADYEAARRLADEAVRASTLGDVRVEAQAHLIHGEVAAAGGDFAIARKHFEEAAESFAGLQQFASVAEALTADGRVWIAQGEYTRAIDRLKAALNWVPNHPGAQLALGQALWWSGQPRASLALLNGAVALARDSAPEALALRGQVLADLGQSADALRDLDRVRHHQQPDTLAARALALADTGRLDAAEQEVLDALAVGPGSGPVLLRSARVYAFLGRTDKAAGLTARALEAADPALPPHLRTLAQELLQGSA
ncbi:tetratricopeptide repeat protein [Sphaerisporangium perillae]|uniref:tetratricopeptide repeat protein n=1 Tax=Sphaerisporangium perillae TaxID=2935860 RepID=UPI00200E4683|nr:tetratricopeptide repeat protein [Sphaerisporangium perillae]